MVVRLQNIRAIWHPIFSTEFLRNGCFVSEHAGRRKDIGEKFPYIAMPDVLSIDSVE